MTLLHQAAQKAVLTDKQIQDAVFVVLRRWNTDRAWDRYTRESGPYDVTSLRPEVLEIIRAVLAIVPPALQHQEVPREPVAEAARVLTEFACACGNVERQGWTHRPEYCWANDESIPSTTRQQEVGNEPDAMEEHRTNGLAWAVSCWQAEVMNRPLVNVHRRTLDDTWRQVIRYFGGDPDKLLGPNHDTLHMRAQEERAWKP